MTVPCTQPWFPFGLGTPEAERRIFCLPFAGGGASNFLPWRRSIASAEIVPVQYPGRETRIEESCHTRLATLVEELAAALAPWADRPYALFGYSLGAKIAFALAHRLMAGGLPAPVALAVAAHRPPDAQPLLPDAASLPDAEFTAHLRRYGGTPDAVLADPELTQMLLPILRADFALAAQTVPEAPLPCPIIAYAGREDAEAGPAAMTAWRRFTRGDFVLHDFAGGHFFFRSAASFLPTLDQDLRTAFSRPGRGFDRHAAAHS